MWEYRATCLDVLDGDTLRLLVDLGFGARHQVDVRLLDVFAPELKEAGGLQTKTFVEGWVGSLPTLKWPMRIETQITLVIEPTERMSFTRYVGSIYNIQSGESLNSVVRNFVGSLI